MAFLFFAFHLAARPPVRVVRLRASPLLIHLLPRHSLSHIQLTPHTNHLGHNVSHIQLKQQTNHLTQILFHIHLISQTTHLTKLISHNSSRTQLTAHTIHLIHLISQAGCWAGVAHRMSWRSCGADLCRCGRSCLWFGKCNIFNLVAVKNRINFFSRTEAFPRLHQSDDSQSKINEKKRSFLQG